LQLRQNVQSGVSWDRFVMNNPYFRFCVILKLWSADKMA